MQNKTTYQTAFLAVSVLGALFVLTEIVFKLFGSSICPYEGCRMTAQYARFGDASIFAIGLAGFAALAALAVLNRRQQNAVLDRTINLILIAALASEGFFMGYLAFRVHTVCIFCITVFVFMVTLGVLRLLAGEKVILAGFAALAAVFSLQYLVLPAGVPVHFPQGERLILFYSKDCKHCSEIMRELEEKKISVAHLPVTDYADFLKNLGIEHVPTLLVNDPYQKTFLTGNDAIRRYLAACTVPAKNPERGAKKQRAAARSAAPAPREGGATIDLFAPQNILTTPSQSSTDADMCKEDEICK